MPTGDHGLVSFGLVALPPKIRWETQQDYRRRGGEKVSYAKPTYYEEIVDVDATTPGIFVAIVAIIVIVAEVVANVAN